MLEILELISARMLKIENERKEIKRFIDNNELERHIKKHLLNKHKTLIAILNELDKLYDEIKESQYSNSNEGIKTKTFLMKYDKVVKAIQQGESLNQAAKIGNVSRSTAQKVRAALNILNNK